jgi:hypothetical protein
MDFRGEIMRDQLNKLQSIVINFTGHNLIGNARDYDGTPRKWYTMMLSGRTNTAFIETCERNGFTVKTEFTHNKTIYWIKVKS